MNFTFEQEQNGQLSFSDILVTRNNGCLNVNIYRKPTHTDRYLDYNSHHDKQQIKISTARTLLHRAAHLPNTNEGKQQEKDRVFVALRSNGYPKTFLDEVEKRRARKTESEELVRMFFENAEPESNSSYAVLPYINSSTEPLKRLLKCYSIRTTTKPLRTLEQDFPLPKDRPLPEKQTNIIYKINCADCSWTYIGETGRALQTRKKEHKINVKQCKSSSNILGLRTIKSILMGAKS